MTLSEQDIEEAISILQDLRSQGVFFLTAIEADDMSRCDFVSIGHRTNDLLNKLGVYGDARISTI